MTASQSRKCARLARRFSIGHRRARPDIQPPPQIAQRLAATAAYLSPVSLLATALDRFSCSHSLFARRSNPHSPRRTARASPRAVSSLGGFRTPAARARGRAPQRGRHPKPFTKADIQTSLVHWRRPCWRLFIEPRALAKRRCWRAGEVPRAQVPRPQRGRPHGLSRFASGCVVFASFLLPGAHTISNTFVEVLRAHCSL